MGVIMHKNILYGGGSTIEPNPQESATEQLEKLGIDGDVYEVTDADYRNTDHTFTMNTYSSYSHTFEDTQISQKMPVRNVFTGIQSLFNSVKTAINDHGSLFGDIATALAFRVTKDNATYKALNFHSYDHTIDDSMELTTQFDGAGETGCVWFTNTNLGVVTDAVNDHAEWIAKETAGAKTVTGNPLTITDAAGIKAEKIVIEFEPKQAGSGTPSPSNIRPITGYTSLSADRCGKNLWGGSQMKSDILSKIATATSPSTNEVSFYPNSAVQTVRVLEGVEGKPFKENTQYTFIVKSKNTSVISYGGQQIVTTNLGFFYTDGTNEIIYHIGNSANTYYTSAIKSNASKTLSYIRVIYQNGDCTFDVTNCGIFEGNVATSAFEAYNGDNVTVQLGQTLYGGKLTILQDGSADVYCDRGLINCGSLTYSYDTSATHPFFVANVSSEIKLGASGISSAYINEAVTLANDTNGAFAFLPNSHQVRIRDNAHTDPTEFKTYLTNNNITIVAELATPFTLHLSPVDALTLLQGINNLWTDGTTLSLTYQPDNAIGQAKGTAQEAMAIANGLKPLYSTGSVGSGKTGSQIIAEITLPEAGIYYITGWARFTGNGKKAVWLWCEGSLSESWEDSNISTAEPKTFSTFAIYTASAAGKVVQVDSYTVSASNAVTGGIVAFKIA